MRLLVIGAHHGTGKLVVELARTRGHDVTPFEGDVLDPALVQRAVSGHDAVISLLGPRKSSPPDLCSRGTRNVIEAMKGASVKRLLVVTGAMVGHPREQLGLVYGLIVSMIPKATLADRQASETEVQRSGLEWTLVRPTRLTDAAAAGNARAQESGTVGAFASTPRAELATFLVDEVEQRRWLQRAVLFTR